MGELLSTCGRCGLWHRVHKDGLLRKSRGSPFLLKQAYIGKVFSIMVVADAQLMGIFVGSGLYDAHLRSDCILRNVFLVFQ